MAVFVVVTRDDDEDEMIGVLLARIGSDCVGATLNAVDEEFVDDFADDKFVVDDIVEEDGICFVGNFLDRVIIVLELQKKIKGMKVCLLE